MKTTRLILSVDDSLRHKATVISEKLPQVPSSSFFVAQSGSLQSIRLRPGRHLSRTAGRLVGHNPWSPVLPGHVLISWLTQEHSDAGTIGHQFLDQTEIDHF
jgi:hypothetical protein